jgi:ferric-dicitrate binding protein FerR (iron transport regulator)
LTTCKRLIAVVLCFLLSPLPAISQQAAGDHAGQIKALIPAATRNAKPAKVKDDVDWNDLLKTEKSGRLRASLKDGSILSVGSNSELRVVQHDAASQQTSLEMDFGKVRSKVVKITQPNGKFEMKTPNAVIGVVGTDFYVGYEANRTTVICYTGKVTVTPMGNAKVLHNSGEASGNSIIVSAGQMVVISSEVAAGSDQASQTPADVLQASMVDTDVPDSPPPPVHPHLVRNLIIGIGAAATGWAVGYTQLNTSGGTAAPKVTNCQTAPNPKLCG